MDSVNSSDDTPGISTYSFKETETPVLVAEECINPHSMQSTLHNFDSVPNIFSQLHEFKFDQQDKSSNNKATVSMNLQKYTDGNVLCTSVISNLQNVLNLSNVAASPFGKDDKTDKMKILSDDSDETRNVEDNNLKISNTDGENNTIYQCVSKKLKIDSNMSARDSIPVNEYKKLYIADKSRDIEVINDQYKENLTELFFLQNGGNLMDYYSWKKRPNTLLACYLLSERLETEDEMDQCQMMDSTLSVSSFQNLSISDQLDDYIDSENSYISTSTYSHPENFTEANADLCSSFSVSNPSSITKSSAERFSTIGGFNIIKSPSADQSGSISHMKTNADGVLKSPTVVSVTTECTVIQETIAELAKQEALVMEKITDLRKKGLWSVKRVPKAIEPPHSKAHWDYVMEEMQWLAADFAQERKGKKAGARRVARMIGRHFQEVQQRGLKAEKEDALKLKRIASTMGKMVKEFWNNIEKVVHYKQQSRIGEKRKKALDLHLNFIVDQTEKYSTWLTEGLGASLAQPKSDISSPATNKDDEDIDFKPEEGSTDDEETIEKEEKLFNEEETNEELTALKKESEMSLEELLHLLPKEIVDKKDEIGTNEDLIESDVESYSPSDDVTDDEETLAEQELQEFVNHDEEISELQREGDMPLEELLKLYSGEIDDDTHIGKCDNVMETESLKKEDAEENEGDFPKDGELNPGPGKEITDIAATALSLQPTGYTLETAHVKTTVPFLLKHSLREYQHVGLDWLGTMFEQRLNGILADEMGLGKTIQTIALLAYLACERGIWGPHLIVVPTSVMLNWEMEFKKWCPAFKILTYYGSLKERKSKRQGWTKTNAFHVCITSYKLVIQDHQAFRRKKWKYFILDEAQNIKNFKSQRWQTLLNFHSQRRLLLTGTPLQNNLMELWSLMHFLMPHVFQSHCEFKEWFSNPLTGMIEGSREYNESLIKRLHKVLRPFLLRRLKQDVEKQMPKKYEHVVMCRLSKHQRFLYDDFMSQAKTKETLVTGHFMSVINILMQLRKVCNHPNLFDPRPIVSPFHMSGITFQTAHLVMKALENDPLNYINVNDLQPCLSTLEYMLPSYAARRIQDLAVSRPMIVELDESSDIHMETEMDYMSVDPNSESFGEKEFESNCFQASQSSPLYLESLALKRIQSRKLKLERMYKYNVKHCNNLTPVYGHDVRTLVNCSSANVEKQHNQLSWNCRGYTYCANLQSSDNTLEQFWTQTDYLRDAIRSPDQHLLHIKDVLTRFVFVIPSATAPRISLHYDCGSHATIETFLQKNLYQLALNLHDINMKQTVQFPELRLIQYDCGKLQTLDVLLRRLKSGSHRVLIFTQMTRMLDVLESFLNFHGHRYLRLDGTTKVEQRQALMERFNMDQRIFCFILSTRSGGIGVNLTGADTVIFYDSDWNPTMDAQAQDRCHRIGQTRDVHIYRLISEKTIEENILKKANEKRLLGNVAIEGGNFTTAFFKQQTIKDLFDEPSGLDSLVTNDEVKTPVVNNTEQGLNEEQMEQALCAAEDESDIQAVKVARAEQKAELAEFDENLPWDEKSGEVDGKRDTQDEESSMVELELAMLDKDLTPVERYAVSFMELQMAPITTEELQKAEEEVGLAKEEWELNHLKAVKEEEERRAELEEDEMLYTSLHYTAWQQDKNKSSGNETLSYNQNKRLKLSNSCSKLELPDMSEDSFSLDNEDSRLSISSVGTESPTIIKVAKKKKKKQMLKKKVDIGSTPKEVHAKASKITTSQRMVGKRLIRPPKRSHEFLSDDDMIEMGGKVKKIKDEKVPTKLKLRDETKVVTTSDFSVPLSNSDATISAKPKLIESKRYKSSPGQRIVIQHLSDASVKKSVAYPSDQQKFGTIPSSNNSVRYQFENKPIPILEKLGASVNASSCQNPGLLNLNSNLTSTINKSVATHFHVSRLNQIVSSISQGNIQNATLLANAPTIQYIIRPSNTVSTPCTNPNMMNASAARSSLGQSGKTNVVLLQQGVCKPNQVVIPAQSSKQSLILLPNTGTGKSNYILAQSPAGGRSNYFILPNNLAQSNIILAPKASMSHISQAVPATRMVIPSGFPIQQQLQIKQTSNSLMASRPLGMQQHPLLHAIPIVPTGTTSTVPILEKLAMQLGGTNIQMAPYQVRLASSTSNVANVSQLVSSSAIMGSVSTKPIILNRIPDANHANFMVSPTRSIHPAMVSPVKSFQSSSVSRFGSVQSSPVTQYVIGQGGQRIALERLNRLSMNNSQIVLVNSRQNQLRPSVDQLNSDQK